MAEILGFPHSGTVSVTSGAEPPCEGQNLESLEAIQNPRWTRTDFLAEAHRLITVDRQEQYGDAHINLANMEIMLDAFDRICRPDFPIAAKAAIRMALVKIARSQTGIHCRDNYTDGAAYLALAGEICDK